MRGLRYEGDVYRPPSEAGSLILQVTIGCAHNRCTFCTMYKNKKYRARDISEIFADIDYAASLVPHTRRIFLADGNALVLETERLVRILDRLNNSFPFLERVGIYSNPQDLLGKEIEELAALKKYKLGMIYLGVESGSTAVLDAVKKGVKPAQIVAGARKVKQSGIPLSLTVINGLAGKEGTIEHAGETARLVSEIDPEYLGLLTLMIVPGTGMARKVARKELTPLSPWEIIEEIRMMVEQLELTACAFGPIMHPIICQ